LLNVVIVNIYVLFLKQCKLSLERHMLLRENENKT